MIIIDSGLDDFNSWKYMSAVGIDAEYLFDEQYWRKFISFFSDRCSYESYDILEFDFGDDYIKLIYDCDDDNYGILLLFNKDALSSEIDIYVLINNVKENVKNFNFHFNPKKAALDFSKVLNRGYVSENNTDLTLDASDDAISASNDDTTFPKGTMYEGEVEEYTDGL